MTQGDENMPNQARSLGVMKAHCCFRFRCAGHNVLNGFTLSKDRTIWRGNACGGAWTAEKEMASKSATSPW